MKSLEQKFDGNSQEVIEYARQFGVSPAMEHYQIKCLTSMYGFLEKKCPSEHFQIYKVNPDEFAQPDAFDKFCEAILKKYTSLEAQIETKDREITELKRNLDYYKANRWREVRPVIQTVLQYCEE